MSIGERMIPSLFLYIQVLLIILFCCYKKKLHLFEIFFIWMTIWLITHSVTSIFIANLKVVDLPQDQSKFWVHFFKRLLLYPLIIIAIFDIYVRVKGNLLKAALIGVSIVVPALLEFLFFYLGIIINKGFHFWMALMEWTFTILLTYFSWLWYRYKRLMR
jgi:hypothetical protein